MTGGRGQQPGLGARHSWRRRKHLVSTGKTSDGPGWFSAAGNCSTLATVVLPLRLVLAGGQESGWWLVCTPRQTTGSSQDTHNFLLILTPVKICCSLIDRNGDRPTVRSSPWKKKTSNKNKKTRVNNNTVLSVICLLPQSHDLTLWPTQGSISDIQHEAQRFNQVGTKG